MNPNENALPGQSGDELSNSDCFLDSDNSSETLRTVDDLQIGVSDAEQEEYWAQQADLLHAYEALIPEDNAEALANALDPEAGWEDFLRFLDLLNALEIAAGVRVGGKELPNGEYVIGVLDDKPAEDELSDEEFLECLHEATGTRYGFRKEGHCSTFCDLDAEDE